jgi:polyhydroxybutyrate depolymerase
VSLLHVHGTGDERIPFDAEHARGARYDFFVSAPDSVAAWAARNGSTQIEQEEHDDGRRRVTRYTGGRAEAVLVALRDAPHAWPTGIARDDANEFDAAHALWSFFQGNSR